MLRKILFFLFSFSFLLSFFAKTPSPAKAAASCSITSFTSAARSGAQPNDTDNQVTIMVGTSGIPNGTDVTFRLKPPGDNWVALAKWDGSRRAGSVKALHLTVNNGTLTIENLGKTPLGAYYYPGESFAKYKVGDYGLEVRGGTEALCVISPGSHKLNVAASETGPDNYCAIHLKPGNNYNVPGGVSFSVVFTTPKRPGDDDDTNKHGFILTNTRGKEWRQPGKYPTSEMESGVAIVQTLSAGAYRVEMKEHFTDPPYIGEGDSCFSNYFVIGNEENPGHECTSSNSAGCPSTGDEPNASLSRPCSDADYDDVKEECTRIKTAFGNVSTSAAGFTRWILGFVLSIAGGIVILIIIITGYRLMTSQGDPEKVKNARDQLTAAIVGLLFIIFSLVILELITKDVLGLPGFGS